MDDSLTNLMNETQSNIETYLFFKNLIEQNRLNLKNILFFIGIILNIFILFINVISINIILYIISLFCFFSGLILIYKNSNYIKNNLIIFSVYIISIIYELVLIINVNKIALLIAIIYQIVYISNFK